MNTTKYSYVTFPIPPNPRDKEKEKESKDSKPNSNTEDPHYIHALKLHRKSIDYASTQATLLNRQHNNSLQKLNRGWEIRVAIYRKELENYMRKVDQWQRQQHRHSSMVHQQLWIVIRDLQQHVFDMSYHYRSRDVGLGRFHPGMNATNFVRAFRFFMVSNDLPANPMFLLKTFLHYMEGGAYDWVTAVINNGNKYHLFHEDFDKFLKDFVARF